MHRLQQLVKQQSQWDRKHRGEHVAHHPDAEAEISPGDHASDGAEVALDQGGVIKPVAVATPSDTYTAPAKCASRLVASGVLSSGVSVICFR